MKTPTGLVDASGKAVKGNISLQGSNGEDIKEFGATTEGIRSRCYVLTSPDDIITVQYALDNGLAAFADLVVDGILRETATQSPVKKPFKGTFRKVCDEGRPKSAINQRKMALNMANMQVTLRNTKNDIISDGEGTLSDVGSIEVQLFQKKEASADSMAGEGSKALRAPTFVEYPHWSDFNSHITNEGPPQFEIGFAGGTKSGKPRKERVIKTWPAEYKLAASLKFLLRSTADLKSLGFKNVPTYYAAPVFELVAKKSKDDEKKDEVKAPASEVRLIVEDDTAELEPFKAGGSSKAHDAPSAINRKMDRLGTGNDGCNVPQSFSGENMSASTIQTILNDLIYKNGKDKFKGYLSQAGTPIPAPVARMIIVTGGKDESSGIIQQWKKPTEKQRSAKAQEVKSSSSTSVTGKESMRYRKKCAVLKGLKGSPAQRAAGADAFTTGNTILSQYGFEDRVVEHLACEPLDSETLRSPVRHALSEPDLDIIPPRVYEARALQELSLEPEPDVSSLSSKSSESPPAYPEAVIKCIEHAFRPDRQLQGITKAQIEAQFWEIVPSLDDETVSTTNWDDMPLPQELIHLDRGGSPTPSDTPTEKATQQEVEASRSNSSIFSNTNSSHSRIIGKPKLSFKGLDISQDGPQSSHSSFGSHGSQFSNPRTPKSSFSHTTASPIFGTPQALGPMPSRTSISSTASSASSQRAPVLNNAPLAPVVNMRQTSLQYPMQKRKADLISDANSLQPQKAVVSPALRNMESLAEATRERLAAAERQKQELQIQYEAALEVQRVKEMIKEQLQIAAQIESENAETKAKIAAIYGASTDL